MWLIGDTLTKKIIKIKSLLKGGIDINKNVKITTEDDVEKLEHLFHDNDILRCTVDKFSFVENNREMVVRIGEYVAKTEK